MARVYCGAGGGLDRSPALAAAGAVMCCVAIGAVFALAVLLRPALQG